jgi:unsaturated rhamnogalacturonyl hydrolase
MGEPSFLAERHADLVERVKVALLGMQRYNWEQGVAAQAMLELGEDEWVVSLARAAIMRQENGRFSVIGSHDPLTDSASVGEAVLYAAKITGDPLYSEDRSIGADASVVADD